MCHDGLACRACEHIVAQADDASRGDLELHVHAVGLSGHREHVAFAAGHHVDHFRGIFLGDVDGEKFHGLAFHAVDLLDDNLGLTHLKLIAFAAHGLDEHRQVEHAAAEHDPCILVVGFLHAEGEVFVKLACEAVLNVA